MDEPAAVGLDVAGGNGAAGGADSGVAHGGNVLRVVELVDIGFLLLGFCVLLWFFDGVCWWWWVGGNGVVLRKTVGKSTNIVWQECSVGKEDRQKLLQQEGCVIWITGLSGSGFVQFPSFFFPILFLLLV